MLSKILGFIMSIIMFIGSLFGFAGENKNEEKKARDMIEYGSDRKSFTVSVSENPSTGYLWELTIDDESVVKLVNSEFIYPYQDGLVGATGTRIFTFETVAPGTTTIVLNYARSWEKGSADTMTITVEVAEDLAVTVNGAEEIKDDDTPFSIEDILKIYNDATRKATNQKVAFTKTRTTIEKKYEAGIALNSFKSIFIKMIGAGDTNKFFKTVTAEDADSYSNYFVASTLTPADVLSAVCKDNGDSYTIIIALKEGSSAVTNGADTQNDKTALDKSGIVCGEYDKSYYDHKTVESICSAISEIPGCSKATIKESYSDAIALMKVAKDGKITELHTDFNFSFDIDGVMGSSGVVEASSSVVMKDFMW